VFRHNALEPLFGRQAHTLLHLLLPQKLVYGACTCATFAIVHTSDPLNFFLYFLDATFLSISGSHLIFGVAVVKSMVPSLFPDAFANFLDGLT
jgi:hypothetical protein